MADKKRAFGRSLSDFPKLNDAEKEIVDAAQEGRFAHFGDKIPDTDEEKKTRTIRAGLLRFLALGGDDKTPVHEQGVKIQGAIVNGELDFGGCTLVGDLVLWACELTDTLNLLGARTRSIGLGGSRCRDIKADRAEFAGSLFLRDGFVARGSVSMIAAKIIGNLNCRNSRFEGNDNEGNALVCDGLYVRGEVSLGDGFLAQGAVRFLDANITGNLACRGGRFEGKDNDGDALVCDRAQVGGGIFLDNGFLAKGTVRLLGTNVAGNMYCGGGRFERQKNSEAALVLDGIRVNGVVSFTSGFVAKGQVRMINARIDGDIVCSGGSFEAWTDSGGELSDEMECQLILARATINGTLWLSGSNVRFYGGVDLTAGRIGRIVDMVTQDNTSQGSKGSPASIEGNPKYLALDGLTYDRFSESTDVTAPARVAFLHLQTEYDLGKGFKPQPWMQMVKVLRESGHTEAAREVAIAYEDQRRKAGQFRWLASFFHWIYGRLAGYGHRPMRLARITLAVWLVCGALFHSAADLGVMAPTSPSVYENPNYAPCRQENLGNWTTCTAPYEYTTFNSVIYSLDLILPLVGLQQQKDWAPMTTQPCERLTYLGICARPWIPFADPHTMPQPGYWPLGYFVWVISLIEILFGWIAGSLFVAVLSGLMKKE